MMRATRVRASGERSEWTRFGITRTQPRACATVSVCVAHSQQSAQRERASRALKPNIYCCRQSGAAQTQRCPAVQTGAAAQFRALLPHLPQLQQQQLLAQTCQLQQHAPRLHRSLWWNAQADAWGVQLLPLAVRALCLRVAGQALHRLT